MCGSSSQCKHMTVQTLLLAAKVALACVLLSVLTSCAAPMPLPSALPAQSPLETPQQQEPTQPAPVSPIATPTAAAKNVVPEKGKAALSGVLYSLNFQRTIPETAFYLIPAAEDKQPPEVLFGPRKEKGDILGFSDAEGKILLNNMPPGDYFMAVWAPLNWILAVDASVDANPRLISLAPDESKALGTINFPWP
jgi:hypothetical protein